MDKLTSVDEWNPDEEVTLDELGVILHAMKKKYGENSTLVLDAGFNNISAYIRKEL